MKVNILIAATCHADVTQSLHPSALISTCEVSEVLFAPFSPFCQDGSSGWRRQLLEKWLLCPATFFSPFHRLGLLSFFAENWQKHFFFSLSCFSTCLKINGNWIFYSSEGMGGGRGMWIPLSLTHTHCNTHRHLRVESAGVCRGDSLTAVKQHSWSPLMWAEKTCRRLPICSAPELWQWSITHARTHAHTPFIKSVRCRPSYVSGVGAIRLCEVHFQWAFH